MSVVGCLLGMSTGRRRDEELTMIHDGWCPDCDDRTAVIDVPTDRQGEPTGDIAWATCVECGAGWVHRDDLPELTPSRTEALNSVTPERHAA
jgi:hypothetical protein